MPVHLLVYQAEDDGLDPIVGDTKLVKRGITELVTPGVVVGGTMLDRKENNFLAAVHFGKKMLGVAFLDISTGEFLTAEGNEEYIDKLLVNFSPKEVLIERSNRQRFAATFSSRYLTFELEDWVFTFESANDRLLKHFETRSLKGFGITSMDNAIIASGAILHYLDITQHTQLLDMTLVKRQGWNLNFNTIVQLGYRINNNSNQFIMLQYYNGYGETMLDYNQYHSRIRFGLLIRPKFFSDF